MTSSFPPRDGPGDGVTRKDFLNGLALTSLTALCPSMLRAAQAEMGPDHSAREPLLERGITPSDPGYYPPALSGMRGSHPGAFGTGHALRDDAGRFDLGATRDTGEDYDLVVVGGGISGLSAAYFFRQLAGQDSRILILDNHDDFGGHAKRNEFEVDGRTLIGYGGTQSLEWPGRYNQYAKKLLAELGVDLSRFETFYDQGFRRRHGLWNACFFDKETFGTDRLVPGDDGIEYRGTPADIEKLKRFVAASPMTPAARKDLLRLHLEPIDYLPGHSADEKMALLARMSLESFLRDHLRVHRDVLNYYRTRLHGTMTVGIDAVDALSGLLCLPEMVCASLGLPGYSISSEMAAEPYIYHFPDGNASIARLLVRSLIPASAPGHTMEDVVTARFDYAALDRPSNAVRLRLNSTAAHVRHLGDPGTAKEVEIAYVTDGKGYRVRSRNVILACWNMIIPYIWPELPEAQKTALRSGVKAPLVYGTVLINNWRAIKQAGVSMTYCPGSYFTEVNMDFPVSMGGYRFTESPDQPCLLHLVRTPCQPGLSPRDQHRAGRAELYTTPFEDFELQVRSQLQRMFGPTGFSGASDIGAITINRWPHGYAFSPSPLWDPELPEAQMPHVVGRQPLGRVSIANSDAGAAASTPTAIAQAMRAVNEVIARS